MTPQLPPPAPLLAGLQVEKYLGWQEGYTPEWQPTPSALHPHCFAGVIFSCLAAKSTAERAACLAMFTVWLPAPAHHGPATHHPEKTPTLRWQGPGRTLCLGHLLPHSPWLAWHRTHKEPMSHCVTIPRTPHTETISCIRQRDEHAFIVSIGTVGASLLVSCSPTCDALQSTAPTEFPFNSCQKWSQPCVFVLVITILARQIQFCQP